ncbi:esterase/lipase [Fusarium sporotrichioides]|uniref:sn-1-specific diacylglycerol lipase n=1 Tax=Fusarium sporotrichioides TaxID=5514 RepID=A0A395RLR1_FUSSP|nr:esterase/lipase [Fusarium sporotrichioides]
MDNASIISAEELPPQPGRTLLPSPVAQAVSLATRSTCLAIRLSSRAGSFGLSAAKLSTLSSLELARGMVETVLGQAGRETLQRSQSDMSTAETESIIERSFEHLHNAMSQAVFWTTAGFHFTNTTFSMASGISQLLLSSLDQIFGSTDSSRAIASIITLIRREFHDPATGLGGETIGMTDLVLGLCALAYLQRWSRKMVEEERKRQDCEEIVWDVVVLNDGERVDIQDCIPRSPVFTTTASLPSRDNSPDKFQAAVIIPTRSVSFQDEEEIIDHLKDEMVNNLPPDTSVSISNTISSTQTVTIDVDGPRPFPLPLLPGAEIIEAKGLDNQVGKRCSQMLEDPPEASSYRVVYKLERSKTDSMSFPGSQDGPVSDVNTSQEESPSIVPAKEPPQVPEKPRTPAAKSPSPQWSRPTRITNDTPSRTSPPTARKSRSNGTREDKGRLPRPNSASPPSSPIEPQAPQREANQKRPRAPVNPSYPRGKISGSREATTTPKRVLSKRKSDTSTATTQQPGDKKTGLRQALREGSQSISNIWTKDSPPTDNKKKQLPKASNTSKLNNKMTSSPRAHLDQQRIEKAELIPRSSSRTSYVSVHEHRRNSMVSQTDTYSFQTGCVTPTHPPSVSLSGPAFDPTGAKHSPSDGLLAPPPISVSHRRIIRKSPSLWSMASNDSQSSVVLSYYHQKSAYTASDAMGGLRRDGMVNGIFPQAHVLRNITRYMRFSSASYGSAFLKFMGISKDMPLLRAWDSTHTDVRHFVHHTESDTHSVLLASIVDPQGGTDSSGSTGTGVPLVHYISLDHDAKAVVLACRGTLGFEDVLADMTCDYDVLTWRGRGHKVHKGVHASARRLLYGGDRRVLLTLREALLEFPDYGLVLCGHSLGGAVTALLGVMLSEPNPTGTGFVTAINAPERTVGDDQLDGLLPIHSTLPSRRPIHVYAYGPPSTMSTSLRKRTRGLITTIVHGNDIVPYLSLGVLHDFQAVALAFKNDQQQAKTEIRQRIWQAFQTGVADKWYGGLPSVPSGDTSKWGHSVLQGLRAGMTNRKLVPPGEVFTIETRRVLRRDAFLLPEEDHIGRPAQRIVLKYVKDVEERFKELRFGTSMLVDHNPARYEEALNKLRLGVV